MTWHPWPNSSVPACCKARPLATAGPGNSGPGKPGSANTTMRSIKPPRRGGLGKSRTAAAQPLGHQPVSGVVRVHGIRHVGLGFLQTEDVTSVDWHSPAMPRLCSSQPYLGATKAGQVPAGRPPADSGSANCRRSPSIDRIPERQQSADPPARLPAVGSRRTGAATAPRRHLPGVGPSRPHGDAGQP